MKKSFFFAALMMVAAMFTACNSSGTPMDDTTKLWPACDAKGENVGYINAKGEMAVPAMYDQATQYSCGFGRVKLAGNYFFLDKNGKNVNDAPNFSDGCDPYFYYNCLCYRAGEYWGMVDNNFKTIIQPAYDFLGYMSEEGLVEFNLPNSDKYGYLNKKGEVAIPANYDNTDRFLDGVATVKVGEKWGAIDKNGQFVINATYDRLQSIGEGRIAFYDYKAEKGGMMDTKGNVIVQAIYEGTQGFADNGLAPVRSNDKWGYVDKNGNVKLQFMYYDAAPFYEGYAWIKRAEDTNYELIDTNGNTVITLAKRESPASVFHNGLCKTRVYNESGSETTKYIDTKGNMVYSWTVTYDAPARVMGDQKMNIAEMFAATPYGARYNHK
jgi:hypothetical protein